MREVWFLANDYLGDLFEGSGSDVRFEVWHIDHKKGVNTSDASALNQMLRNMENTKSRGRFDRGLGKIQQKSLQCRPAYWRRQHHRCRLGFHCQLSQRWMEDPVIKTESGHSFNPITCRMIPRDINFDKLLHAKKVVKTTSQSIP